MPLPQRYQFIVISYGCSSIDFGPRNYFLMLAHKHKPSERATTKWLDSMNCETKNEWKNDTNDLINKFSFSASSVSHFIGFDSLGFAISKKTETKSTKTK